MKYSAFALILTASGAVFSQAKLETPVKPATKTETKEEAKGLDPAVKAKVDALVVKLGDDSFKVRRKAKEELLALGKDVGPYLYKHLAHDDVEVRENVKEVLAKIDPYPGLKPSRDEPQFFRKRALKNGAKPTTVGEKLWLDKYRKGNPTGAMERDEARLQDFRQAAAGVAEKAMAKKKLEEVTKVLAEQKAAEEKAKAVAAKKVGENVRSAMADALEKGAAEIRPEPEEKKDAEKK